MLFARTTARATSGQLNKIKPATTTTATSLTVQRIMMKSKDDRDDEGEHAWRSTARRASRMSHRTMLLYDMRKG